MCQLMATRSYGDHNNRPTHSKQQWARSADRSHRHEQTNDKPTGSAGGSKRDRSDERMGEQRSKPRQRQIGDWSEHTSSSGKRYYYNTLTEQSQWEKPLEWLEYEKLNGLSKQKKSVSHSETNGQDKLRSSGSEEKSRLSSRHHQEISNGVEGSNRPVGREEIASSSKRQRDSSAAESHHRNDNGYDVDNRERSNHSRKRRDQTDSPAFPSNSPKRRKGGEGGSDVLGATEDTNASTSCSNEMDSSNTDGIVEAVDLDKLPELLVEIAEKYNIDLTQPDALDKLKHYLKTTIQTDNHPVKVKADDSIEVPSVIQHPQPSPSSSAKSNCIESATDPEEAAVDSLPEARVRRIPTPLPEIPVLSQNHLIYFREPLAAHVSGWNSESFERSARVFNGEAFRIGCLQVTQVSADLKCARSLVRTAEIQATLLDQRIAFLRQQQEKLDVKRSNN